MYKRLLGSKKGFTIVELMIVLILLGFGAFAIMNLSQSSWRAFNKTEERYEKQELVKNLADMLQKEAKISSASSATVFSDLGVLPQGDNVDDSYSYLYCVPVYKNADGDYTEYQYKQATEGIKWVGYRLYVLNKKAEMPGTCLNPNTPLYITIDAARGDPINSATNPDGTPNPLYNEQYLPEIKVMISATESDATFIDRASDDKNYGFFTPSSSDDIYYGLNVNYHFPNMATADGQDLVVNAAESYTVNGRTINVADKGIVLQLTIDSILSGDNTENEATVSSFCFIATASYGHGSSEVGLLCDFRDSVLMQSAPGRAFVKAYYTVSPPIAKVIAGSEPLKAAVRTMLKPLVIVATFALDHDLLAANTAYIIILMISAAAAITVIVYCSKKRKKE